MTDVLKDQLRLELGNDQVGATLRHFFHFHFGAAQGSKNAAANHTQAILYQLLQLFKNFHEYLHGVHAYFQVGLDNLLA